jgi:hypothetical protein
VVSSIPSTNLALDDVKLLS